MKRTEAIKLLKENIKNENMLKHCYASEAVMRALAKRLGKDEEKWGLAGLLHDLDVEKVNADPKIHGLETAKMLAETDIDPEIIDAIKELYSGKYDMAICFPPCTDLAVSGAAHFEKKRADGRQQLSIDLFMKVARAPIKKICIENPVGIMSSVYRKPDQKIQPWQFGDKAQKTTCLWLKNLNKLEPTNIVEKGEFFEFISKKGKKKRFSKWYYDALLISKTSEERSTMRSKTFPGIAKAMAEQFTKPLKQTKLAI